MKNDNEILGPMLPPEDETTKQLEKACLYLLCAFICFVASLITYNSI